MYKAGSEDGSVKPDSAVFKSIATVARELPFNQRLLTGNINLISPSMVEMSGEMLSFWTNHAFRAGLLKSGMGVHVVVQKIPGIPNLKYVLAYNAIGATSIYGVSVITQTVGLYIGTLCFIWFQWFAPTSRFPWAVISGSCIFIIVMYLLLTLRAKYALKILIAQSQHREM